MPNNKPVSSSLVSKFQNLPQKTKLLYAAGGVFILLIVLLVGYFGLSNNNSTKYTNQTANQYNVTPTVTQTTSTGAFNFADCLRDNTKPGDDANKANDICITKQKQSSPQTSTPASNQQSNQGGLGDANSTDPMQKGLALTNGQCEGTGATKLTHAPMDMKDVGTIQPMGAVIGGHVTPIDHEYYYQTNFNAPKNTYPVYADGDGFITEVGDVNDGTKEAWRLTIAHSCTFLTIYNLLTSITPEIKAKLPAGWGPNNNGGVKIAIKAGEKLGYVGGQSLDYQLSDTTTQLKGFLNIIAYNNREPWKVNTVRPLDYFSDEVKTQVLTKYIRTVEPRDGKIDYDVDGQAIGTWFVQGTNGYAGGEKGDGSTPEYATHLSLAPDSLDPTAMVFSIGDFKGQPTQFAIKGTVDFTKITQASGLIKLELAQRVYKTSKGDVWSGQYATDIKLTAGPSQATALIQMTENQVMKVEVFAGKTPAQVTGFTSAVKVYNRGQDAHVIKSNTAH